MWRCIGNKKNGFNCKHVTLADKKTGQPVKIVHPGGACGGGGPPCMKIPVLYSKGEGLTKPPTVLFDAALQAPGARRGMANNYETGTGQRISSEKPSHRKRK
jgi:hypothetical protein